jgi:PAS domain S-box-containing protein
MPEGNDLLHTIINTIGDEIYLKDTERRFVVVNRAVLNMLGKKSTDDVIGLRDEDLINPEFLEISKRQDEMVLGSGIPIINIEGFAYTDASQSDIKRSMLISKYPRFNKEGTIIGLIGINRDITDRKRGDLNIVRNLQETRARLDQLSDLMTERDQLMDQLLQRAMLEVKDPQALEIFREMKSIFSHIGA